MDNIDYSSFKRVQEEPAMLKWLAEHELAAEKAAAEASKAPAPKRSREVEAESAGQVAKKAKSANAEPKEARTTNAAVVRLQDAEKAARRAMEDASSEQTREVAAKAFDRAHQQLLDAEHPPPPVELQGIVGEACNAWAGRRNEARSDYNRMRRLWFADVARWTPQQWVRTATSYRLHHSYAHNGVETAYWSLMVNFASCSQRDDLTGGKFNLDLAGVALLRWEEEEREFRPEEELRIVQARKANRLYSAFVSSETKVSEDEGRVEHAVKPPAQPRVPTQPQASTQPEVTAPPSPAAQPVSAAKARPYDVLDPRYKYSTHTPVVKKLYRTGTCLTKVSSPAMFQAHRVFCKFILRRLIRRMNTGNREKSNVKTVPLTYPQMRIIGGKCQTRHWAPRPGAYLHAREITAVARSRHEAKAIFGDPQARTISRGKIDRLAAIVRYSRAKKRTIAEEAKRVRALAKGLLLAFPELTFPDPEDNVLIAGERTQSSMTPSLWYNEEKEIEVHSEGFVFQEFDNPRALDGLVSTHAIAEAFTGHITGHLQICKQLNLNPSFILIGVDAMGSNWDRMVAYIRDTVQSLGHHFDIFIRVKAKSINLCPRVNKYGRYGVVRSEDLLIYDTADRHNLSPNVTAALKEWKLSLSYLWGRNILQKNVQTISTTRN
ncbi:hypothetical protein KCU81_g2166, partial [Aureobasidium melanogenum]|uniref:Uncharacterized protein n=1 Tax=Aureobasidium melanogenum (strain CBS 110374) TaxID=1043003 RepID=A0A074VNI8_AURM1